MKNKFRSFLVILSIFFLGLGSIALYGLFSDLSGNLLSHLGITNSFLQYGIVILAVILFFVISGISGWKSVEKLVKA